MSSTSTSQKYIRRPFIVVGYQVSLENIEKVARWCEGQIYGLGGNRPYIRVPVDNPTQNRSRYEAKIGDHVLRIGRTFKVYGQVWLDRSFIHIEEDDLDSEELLDALGGDVVAAHQPPNRPEPKKSRPSIKPQFQPVPVDVVDQQSQHKCACCDAHGKSVPRPVPRPPGQYQQSKP